MKTEIETLETTAQKLKPTTPKDSEPQSAGSVLGEPETITCKECGKPFELPFPTKLASLVTKCPECCDRQIAAQTKASVAACGIRSGDRQADWKRFCPPAFLETAAHRLPSPSKLQEVLKWQYGRSGLLLHGETGRGKSRCAWELIKREFMAGRRIETLNCFSGIKYGSLFAENAKVPYEWVSDVSKADLVFLDDVWKSKLTDSFEQAVFAIINNRVENLLPIIATTNDTGETLANRMGEDRAAPMVRRLRENCKSIEF